MSDLFESLSMPYVFPHEDGFALGVGALIAGLLLFRFVLARWNRNSDRAEH
jgi:hypothetical protein